LYWYLIERFQSAIPDALAVSLEKDTVEPRAKILLEARILGGAGPNNIHLSLPHLVPAVVENDLGGPKRNHHNVVTKTIGFLVTSLTLLPVLFDRPRERKEFLPMCINVHSIRTSDPGDGAQRRHPSIESVSLKQ
jgi:hypothetical protein